MVFLTPTLYLDLEGVLNSTQVNVKRESLSLGSEQGAEREVGEVGEIGINREDVSDEDRHDDGSCRKIYIKIEVKKDLNFYNEDTEFTKLFD